MGDASQNYTDVDFGISLDEGRAVRVYENGVWKGDFGSYTTSDRFRVSVESGVVKYRKNGTLLYTSAVAPSYPLVLDAAFYSNGATVTNVVISGLFVPNLASSVENVVWAHVVGAANNLTKTAVNGWGDSGAISTKALASGDGYVEFGILLNGAGSVYVSEKGVLTGPFGPYAATDRFRVAVVSGVVKYLKNGSVFATSTTAPTYPLVMDTALYYNGGTITNAIISGVFAPNQAPVAKAGGPYGGQPGSPIQFNGAGSSDADGIITSYTWNFGDGTTGTGVAPTHTYASAGTYTVKLTVQDDSGLTASATTTATVSVPALENVVWTHLVGAMATANNLTKTATTGWGNAGAISTRSLASGDGYVEFGTGQINGAKLAGLGVGDASQNYTDVDFGISLDEVGSVYVYENGVQKGAFGSYATTDRYRVSVESGVVKYRKNGTLFYTSAVAPSYPLVLDAALYSNGATITNAVISGSLQ